MGSSRVRLSLNGKLLMKELPSDYISQNSYDDAIDRRGFLKCMAWAGTGFSAQTIPMVVEATQLKQMLGLTSVDYTETNHTLAVVDSTLE
jgi:hypothetical protein